MATIDYELEYNNRARVPENPAIIAGWARDAAAYRDLHPPRSVRYGESARQTIDVFKPQTDPVATVMFIHGGYWQALDASFFSHLAAGLNARGVSVAMPSYDLCPQVSVATIIAQLRTACVALARETRSLVVSGHSAGGHLAACLLATDWSASTYGLPADYITSAYSISGLFDLGPLVSTSVNTPLHLDASTAHAASPLFWPPRAGTTLDAVVGSEESREYHRQSQTMVEQWGAQSVATRYDTIANANHFTAIAPLSDPESAMTRRILAMAMSSTH